MVLVWPWNKKPRIISYGRKVAPPWYNLVGDQVFPTLFFFQINRRGTRVDAPETCSWYLKEVPFFILPFHHNKFIHISTKPGPVGSPWNPKLMFLGWEKLLLQGMQGQWCITVEDDPVNDIPCHFCSSTKVSWAFVQAYLQS